ncbi:MAG: hypothetical protein M3Z32_08350, partial [Acidobacteriota bacterium]|nr:hypothetical protein [Acidobacteriota bacterium]
MRGIEHSAYAKVLSEALPRVIQTAKQNDEYIELLDSLDGQPRLSPEEEALADFITASVEKFEEERYGL